MTDTERKRGTQDSGAETDAEPSAKSDLAAGLELMMRAAHKATSGLDRARLEQLGRRAVQAAESLDRKTVENLGRRAARHLDPSKIEEIAQEAGRELMNVVERVTDRIEQVVSRRSRPPQDDDEDDHPSKPRVRVDD